MAAGQNTYNTWIYIFAALKKHKGVLRQLFFLQLSVV